MPPEIGCTHALLLQGPPGPFFRRLATEFRDRRVTVTKVNFNGGDELFFPDGIAYRDAPDKWPEYVEHLITQRSIDAIILFGDCRPIHRVAIERAHRLGVAVWVFEEGYLRPDFITLERDGVNGYSSLPRDPAFYHAAAVALPPAPSPQSVGQSFARHALYSARYALHTTLAQQRFATYVHHRPLTPWMHAAGWLRGGARKPILARRQRLLLPMLTERWSRRFFLAPLQVHADYQILAHSTFANIEEMIAQVLESFAINGPDDTLLVFKHHPMDRGYCDYTAFIAERADALGVGARVYAIHDLHLPTLLRHTRGVVTINSTVGLSAIHHRAPVKLLGTAMYDLPGLTAQGSLAGFWQLPPEPDDELYRAFVTYLRWTNQHNGNFYRPLHSYGTGVNWLAEVPPVHAQAEVQATEERAGAARLH